MKKYLLIFTGWLLLIFFINKVSVNLVPDRTSYELPVKTPFTFSLAPLLNMDGKHYLDIACKGYTASNTFDLRVFFPVYPLLIKSFSLNCRINPVMAGLAVSWVSLFLSLLILTKMVKEKNGLKTLLLFLFFPTSFFFATYYTESVFLLLVLLTFWFLDRKKYLAASIIAAIASATRLLGIALFPVLLYQAYKDYKKDKKFRFEVLLAPLGLVLFSTYNFFSTGSAFTFLSTQSYWNRPVGLVAPFYGLARQFINVVSGPLASYDSPFVYPVILIEFVVLLYVLAILYFSFRKIKDTYWIYTLVSLVIILFAGPSSFPRYALVLFPAYLFLGEKLSGFRYGIYLFCSLILFLFMASLYLRGYWSS